MILFPADSLQRTLVERDYQLEFEAAQNAGLSTAIFDFDGLRRGESSHLFLRRMPENEMAQPCIYRGWMLQLEEYTRLFEGLQTRGWSLANDPARYRFAHHGPENYALWQGVTPQTEWIERASFARDGAIDFAPIHQKLQAFGSQAVVLKDWVKSQKQEWLGACFIADASDKATVHRVVSRFLELRGEDLTGGLLFRRFVPLRAVDTQTVEWRSFWFEGELLSLAPHLQNAGEAPDLAPFLARAKQAPSRFFSLDVAQSESGEWTAIEMGDGGVSGLASGEDFAQWYRNLAHRIG